MNLQATIKQIFKSVCIVCLFCYVFMYLCIYLFIYLFIDLVKVAKVCKIAIQITASRDSWMI